jgi:hypothetical protein
LGVDLGVIRGKGSRVSREWEEKRGRESVKRNGMSGGFVAYRICKKLRVLDSFKIRKSF